MITAPYHGLSIHDLRVPVCLGFFPEERQALQDISIHIDVRFNAAPTATHSDQLSETICYGAMVTCIKATLFQKEYQLIERCAADIYAALKELVSPHNLRVEVRKLTVPIQEIKDYTRYVCSDWESVC
jgi:dihydroneopterin aldolase